ncbi:hypothetical protein [Pirellulimonas nuda]|uniref:hypothetical protein n=1 Tax=Pirellulimonas nuda TaxID=2528009 RepID=UPI0011A334E1|nr:hypothetical protein [Pirellulimonas nuda]
MKNLILALSLFVVLVQTGCNRNHVDGRLITSYSVETASGDERKSLVLDLEVYLAKSGMKKGGKGKDPGFGASGFHNAGEAAEFWVSPTGEYSLSIVLNPNGKLLSGDIGWDFNGDRADWVELEAEIVGFQTDLVNWFRKRPEVIQKESSYWDGKL